MQPGRQSRTPLLVASEGCPGGPERTGEGDGALDKLTVFHLLGNQITDDGFATFMPYLKNCSNLSNLTAFSIGSGITDKGMKEFADILSNGALASLSLLSVDDCEHPALKDACQARGINLF